ncbi:MAG: response regulator, partial [Bacteroidota bacterium]
MNTESLRILIVEDDMTVAESTTMMIEELGYSVVAVCYSYKEAIKKLPTTNFDLAIIDIHLSSRKKQENGIVLGKYINENIGKPFIFLTVLTDQQTIKAAARCRPAAYLNKPLTESKLFSAIQLAIQNYRNNQVAQPEDSQNDQPYFFVKVGRKMHQVKWVEVFGLRSAGHYVEVLTLPKVNTYPVRASLKTFFRNNIPNEYSEQFV